MSIDDIAPGERYVAITPSDTAGQGKYRGLYVGSEGDVALKDLDGNTITFTGLASGMVHPLQFTHILSTGTTADNIIGVN